MPWTVSLCAAPLRECLKFQLPSMSPGQIESQVIFTARSFGGLLLFLALRIQAGEPCVGLGPLPVEGGPLQLRYPSQFLTATHGCRASPFPVFTRSTSLKMASLYSYSTSVRLVFEWFSKLIVLYILVAILMQSWDEASTMFTYSIILTRTLTCFFLIFSSPVSNCTLE